MRRPASVEYDRGSLVVRYPGGVHDVLELRPAPRPRGARVRLSWDPPSGIVLDGADPPGAPFEISDQSAARRLALALAAHGPVDVVVRGAPPPDPAPRATEGRGTTERATSARVVDAAVLADPRPGSFLLAAARRWAPRAPVPLKPPWSPAHVDAFVASGSDARALAATVCRTWKEYTAAGGEGADQYGVLAEALLVQAERGNPSADPGFLAVRRGPSGWGLYRRGVRWYDDKGLPVIGPAGVYWDHTYAPLGPPPFAVQLVIRDPALYSLVTYLRQAMAGGTLEVAAAAQGYAENGDLLLPAVMKDWDFLGRLEDEALRMVPVLVMFLAAELVGRFLVTFGKGELQVLGLAVLAGVKVAGYAMDVQFYGQVALLAVAAGRELLLVRRTADGRLDELARRHLAAAAGKVREIVVAMVTLLSLKAARSAGKPLLRAGRAVAVAVKDALTVRPELAPAWAGAYGEGPTYAEMGTRPETRSSSRGGGAVPEPPAGGRPRTWRQLEAAVKREFHERAPRDSATYFTTKSSQLSVILAQLRAHVERLKQSGVPELLAQADPGVLSKTRRELLQGTELLERAEAMGRSLEARARATEQVRNRVSDPGLKRRAAEDASAAAAEYARWVEWMNVRIGEQKLDLIEFDLANRQAHVVDPSFAWRDPWHNLKSEVYLFSVNRALGWEGGTALDVGDGMFAHRMMYGSTAD
ncbi:hypothetical protein [Streptomyces sp. NPDC004065]|uniref:hypothetical protein n=1 Tax=Streptomyces sp. NPDC004065 TaxID=3364689 RepID=UPI00384C125A